MEPRLLLVGLVMSAWTAGCVAPGEGLAPLDLGPAPASAPAAPAWGVLTWEGHIVAGAAAEAPAHLMVTETAVAPAWKSGFSLMVDEVPSAFELRLDWTSATPTEMLLMAHIPHDEEQPRDWWEYENPMHADTTPVWPAEGPLCMRIPVEEVAPGHWHIMAHARYGQDIRLTFTMTSLGGDLHVGEGLHGHVLDAEEAWELVEVKSGLEPQRAWGDCTMTP